MHFFKTGQNLNGYHKYVNFKTFIIFNFCVSYMCMYFENRWLKQLSNILIFYILILLLCKMRLIICVSYVENWLLK